MNKKWLIVAAVVVLVAILGFAVYQRISARRATAETPMETAVVRRGTLLVTVSATGNLVPDSEVSVAFLSGGWPRCLSKKVRWWRLGNPWPGWRRMSWNSR